MNTSAADAVCSAANAADVSMEKSVDRQVHTLTGGFKLFLWVLEAKEQYTL